MEKMMPLTHQLLIAAPTVDLDPFSQTVVYVCQHELRGSFGLIINQPLPYSMNLVFDNLQVTPKNESLKYKPLMFGGPMEKERGFVLHRPFGEWRSSRIINEKVTITTSNDIIRALAANQGPKDSLVALGFVAWDTLQLEQEVRDTNWLVCPFAEKLIYDVPYKDRWYEAGLTMGVDMNHLITRPGHG